MKFEWDDAKSKANVDKHGIDFNLAIKIWDDPKLLEIPARTDDEPRWVAIAVYLGKHWSAVFTRRGQTIRLISVRRSRKEEIEIYES